jgi:acyl-CoA synthetase (AMP-forming)/AMP-acid ligase II
LSTLLSHQNFLKAVESSIALKNPLWRFPEENLELTVADLWEESGYYAGTLTEYGIEPGKSVGISVHRPSDFAKLILAVFRCGATIVPIKPLRGEFPEIREFLQKVQLLSPIDLIIYDEETDDGNIDIWRRISGKPGFRFDEFAKKTAAAKLTISISDRKTDTAIIQYSSGSTGMPKGVIVTWDMVITQVRHLHAAYIANGGPGIDCSNSSWLPLHHDMGLFMGMLFPLYLGFDNMIASPRYFMARPGRWYQMLSDLGVTLSFTTNSAMAFCLRQLERLKPENVDLSRLHQYLGAEKVSGVIMRQTIAALVRIGIKPEHISVGYGMAENALGATQTQLAPPKIINTRIDSRGTVSISEKPSPDTVELVSCGVPFNGVKITIRDKTDKPLPELQMGEISVKGPCVMPGYINDSQHSAEALPEPGRLLTNDLGFIYNGQLYFHARKDDLLILGGRNIVPDDIEMAVEDLDFIKQGSTILIGVENPKSGLRELHFLVESNPETPAGILNERKIVIRNAVLESFGLLLNHIYFCKKNTIIKTSSGKKRRKVIRDIFIQGQIKFTC